MSATFNWSIKPGVANRYGITIPATADNVRPAGFAYVALFGNDVSGNGSRQYPFKTISKCGLSGKVIVSSGTYRENIGSVVVYGDGDVKIECIFFSISGGQYSGCEIYATNNIGNPVFNMCYVNIVGTYFSGTTIAYSNIIDMNGSGNTMLRSSPYTLGTNGNNTYVNGLISFGDPAGQYGMGCHCIYYNCKFDINVNATFDYSLFYNCQFRMGSSGAYTAIDDLPTLLAFIKAVYPTNSGFSHCVFGDPLFNNPAIADYTLAFNSPAKNASYIGTFVGARSIAYPIQAKTTESAGGFEFSSAVNLTITDDSITLTNPAIDAQVDTKVIVNIIGRQLSSFPSYGVNADRNGQYIDSIADLDSVTKAAGDALSIPVPYLVEIGAIVYNGATYQPGERFTTVTGQTTFTTVASGVVREILEAPQRHTIMARFSDGGEPIAVGTALTVGYYYFVESGSVTYDSTTYNEGNVFKAIDTNAFSGTGIVVIAFSTESFQHYEPSIQPTSNNEGDTRLGAIIRGNGDPAYLRGGLGVNEFPINAKFIQIRYYIRVNNLKP